LRRRQLQRASAVFHDGSPGELLAHRGLKVFNRRLINSQKDQAIAIATLSSSLVFQNVGRSSGRK